MTSLKNSIVTLFLVTSCIAGCTGSTAGVLVDEADLGAGTVDGPSVIGLAGTPVTITIPSTAPTLENLDAQGGHVSPMYANSFKETQGAQSRFVAHIPVAGIPVGATLTNITASVQNSPGDGCFFAFYDQFHGQFRDASGTALPGLAPEAWFSSPTVNPQTASWQSISLQQPFSWTIQSGHTYSIVMHFGNAGPCFMEGLQATYIPAP